MAEENCRKKKEPEIDWQGKPLKSFELMLNYIRGTKTEIGLEVKASLLSNEFTTGKIVTDKEMKSILIERHNVWPDWNYTIRPRNIIINHQ